MGKQGMVYTRKVIAQLLELSERHVRRLTEDGVIEEFSPGHYKLAPAVQGYLRYLRSQIADDGDGTDYSHEKARLTRIKREDAELDLRRKRNELHHAADVEFVVTNSLLAFKAKLETLPYKVLPRIVGIPDGTDKAERTLSVLKSATAEALRELSDYQPGDFAGDKHPATTDELIGGNMNDGTSSNH